ncbi:MAG TPA: glycosyltransferase [Bacteroidia bacterium]
MKEQKLKILFLSGWYPNRVLPTLGNFVQKHAEAVALNSEVTALNVWPDATCKGLFEITEQRINNVLTINVYYKKVNSRIPLISSFQKLSRLKKAYTIGIRAAFERSGQPDIVHHNILYPSGFAAWCINKEYKVPYIICEHSTAYLPSKNIHRSLNERMLSGIIAKSASFICPVSVDLRNAMISKGIRGNYQVVYNVVDTKVFYPPAERPSTGKTRFLHISTLDDSHKNISGMLRAIAELSNLRNDFECVFAGDGDTAPHVELAAALGIYNTFVFFEGTKTTVKVAEMMRKSDCFLMFSNYENLPVVIIEAFASGLPVISSRAGGIHEHLSHDKGILVDVKDEKALTAAMDKMITGIKGGIFSRKTLADYAGENFSYEKVSERFHQLYHRTLEK